MKHWSRDRFTMRSVTSMRPEIGWHSPKSGLVFKGQGGGRGIRTHGDVAATMVFKSIRGSLSSIAPTCAFGMSAFYVIQDHPAYIP